jgi:hypothetical protein
MQDPWELVHLVDPDVEPLDGPVLIVTLEGFVDAGHGVRILRDHLLGTGHPRVIASFDVDQLVDHRARRPSIVFDADRWTDYNAHELTVHRLRDDRGTEFLLLTGPEPDWQWERFAQAVRMLIERLGVRLTIGLHAVPMAVPHTRPIQVTAHATREELLTEPSPGVGRVQVPATMGHVLELRLGEADHDAVGFAAFVPHYLGDVPYPDAAIPLLAAVERASGLLLGMEALVEPGQRTRENVDEQVRSDEQTQQVVRALEVQFDAVRSQRAIESDLPSPDELGDEIERFLSELPPGDK